MQLLNKIKNTHNENFPCLTTFKEDARRINDEKFDRLNGKIFMMKAVYERFEEQKLNKNSLPLDMEMKYKIGERVIILANKFNAFINDYEYYNGSIGVIENYFIDPDCIEKSKCDVRLDNGNEVTVDYKEWKQTRYRLNNYGEYEEIIIGVFKQMPLLPAYAMTIHRCQGMTLDGINLINPNSAFADGQLYVALSRVKDFNNIYSNEQIDINSFKVCPYVLEYFKDYENVFLFSRENDKDLTTYIIYFHDENIECIRKYPKNAPYHRFNQNYFEYVSMDSYEYNDIVNAINDMKKNSSNILKNINYVKILEYNNDNI
jgi:hypothetical protein